MSLSLIGILNAQETISAKELIGTWTYIGADKPGLNDTIVLTKDLTNTKSFIQWTFISLDNILEKEARVVMKVENDSTKIIHVKSKGIKWFVFNPNLLVIENNNDQQNFRVSEKTQDRIEFVKIK